MESVYFEEYKQAEARCLQAVEARDILGYNVPFPKPSLPKVFFSLYGTNLPHFRSMFPDYRSSEQYITATAELARQKHQNADALAASVEYQRAVAEVAETRRIRDNARVRFQRAYNAHQDFVRANPDVYRAATATTTAIELEDDPVEVTAQPPFHATPVPEDTPARAQSPAYEPSSPLPAQAQSPAYDPVDVTAQSRFHATPVPEDTPVRAQSPAYEPSSPLPARAHSPAYEPSSPLPTRRRQAAAPLPTRRRPAAAAAPARAQSPAYEPSSPLPTRRHQTVTRSEPVSGAAAQQAKRMMLSVEDRESKDGEDTCVICACNFACIKSSACGHRVMCFGCSSSLSTTQASWRDKCPVCREKIQNLVVAF